MTVDKKLSRQIFENTLNTMKRYFPDEFFSLYPPGMLRKRDLIKKSLLEYYESTEEFEKCAFVIEFFKRIEDLLTIEEQKIKNS